MTKLFQLQIKLTEDKFYCFADNAKNAKNIIITELFNGEKKPLIAKDITSEKINEDGVKILIDSNFIGVPAKTTFFLNTCLQSSQKHFKNNRSNTLWWSEKVPESKGLWK